MPRLKVKLEDNANYKIVEKAPISPLTIDFGREDLNALRDKLNEVINELSK